MTIYDRQTACILFEREQMKILLQAFVLMIVVVLFTGCGSDGEPATFENNHTKSPMTMPYNQDGVSIEYIGDNTDARVFLVLLDKTFSAKHELFPIIAYVSPGDITNENALPSGVYRVTVKLSADEIMNIKEEDYFRQIWEHLVKAYEKAFHVKISKVNRSQNVLVLRISENGVNGVKPADESDNQRSGTSSVGYGFHKYTFAELACFLSEEVGDFVHDETQDAAAYNFEVPVDVFRLSDPNAWAKSLKEIGLELSRETRNIDVIVIEKQAAENINQPPEK